MFRDTKRGAYYAKQRRGQRRSDVAAASAKTVRGKSSGGGLSAQSKAYLQAHGSPFTDSDQLPFQIEPRIPDPEYTGSTTVCNTTSDFTLTCPNGTFSMNNVTGTVTPFNPAVPATMQVLTSTKPFYFGGVDVLTTSNVIAPCTVFPNVALACQKQQDQSYTPPVGSPPTIGPTTALLANSLANTGLRYLSNVLSQSINMYNTRQQSADAYYHTWESNSWKHRMIGNAVKCHDIGAVETQQGLIQAYHLRPEAMIRIGQEILMDGLSNSATSIDMQRARLWTCYGPASLFMVGNDPTSITALTSAGTNCPQSYNDVIDASSLKYKEGLSDIAQPSQVAGGGQHSGDALGVQQEFLRSLFQKHSIRNRDAGEEFLTSDGCSMRGFEHGAERPFHDVQDVTWQNPDAVTTVAATTFYDDTAEQVLAKNAMSRDDIMQWLATVRPLFVPVNRIQSDVSRFWFQYLPLSAVPNQTCTGDYQLMIVSWGHVQQYWQNGAINDLPNNTLDNDGFQYSVILCDLAGIPIAMRFSERFGEDSLPLGAAPFMYFHIDAVAANRTFKIYRADYTEFESSGDFIVPAKFSPSDQNWDDVSVIAAGFPSITKGFTFFATLAAGIKQAASFVWANREGISQGIGIVKGMLTKKK